MVDTHEADEIRNALSLIIKSPRFIASENMSKFITYVVERSLAGEENQLKAYSIAVDALGRPENFDAQSDPIVRVLAGRVRTSLSSYYAEEGQKNPIVISVPTGGYKPHFTPNEVTLTEDFTQSAVLSTTPPNASLDISPQIEPQIPKGQLRLSSFKWLGYSLAGIVGFVFITSALLWQPLQDRFIGEPIGSINTINISVCQGEASLKNETENQSANLFFKDLKASLARNKALSVQIKPRGRNSYPKSSQRPLDFVIDCTFKQGSVENVEAAVELINNHTGSLVWGRSYNVTANAQSPRPLDDVVTRITRELNTQIFGASIAALEGRDLDQLSATQLFVLATWVPGAAKNTLSWEQERVQLARLAIEKDTDFGPAHSVLADKLAYLAAVNAPSNTIEAAEEAKRSAQRALELDSHNVNTLFNVAQYYWHSGQLDEAIRTQARILELDPNHGFAKFFSTVIPYTCSAAPDDALNAAIAFDHSLETDNPIRWVTLTWIGWLHMNRQEFDLALNAEQRSAQIFQIPYSVMRHATLLNLVNRTEEAVALIESQRKNWPNLDPRHFSDVTMPRLCNQRSGSELMIGFYEKLADTM